MQVNGYRHFESQKSTYRQDEINTCGSWRYIEVLWSETIRLWKKLHIIYNIITCNTELEANGPEQCPVHKWIIRLNRFFLVNYMNKFTKSPNWLKQFVANEGRNKSFYGFSLFM